MALMFQRLARNFIKNGYFPTDEETLARILTALDVGGSRVRIFDPCCGEGTALAEVRNHLGQLDASVESFGVEFDSERAWHGKKLLDTVAHADFNDVAVTYRSIGLLWLNPPYGYAVADTAKLSDRKASERLEMQFFRRAMGTLQFGGILVFIVPFTLIDEDFAISIARNFDQVSIYLAPEKRFKQIVVLGIKRRSSSPDQQVVERLKAFGQGQCSDELPLQSPIRYQVPQVQDAEPFSFVSTRIDGPQLAAEIARLSKATLWPRFDQMFGLKTKDVRPPLRDMTDWHLALALASGQIQGVVHGRSGQCLLIKGDTIKIKRVETELVWSSEKSSEIRIATDQFVPTIRGIDLTPGIDFGRLVVVQ